MKPELNILSLLILNEIAIISALASGKIKLRVTKSFIQGDMWKVE